MYGEFVKSLNPERDPCYCIPQSYLNKEFTYEREEMSKKLFGVVAGPRLSGKTTLAGTLPGKTLLLQAEVYESGAGSAVALAKKNGHDLDIVEFSNLQQLRAQISELAGDEVYDNIYVDGVSAITEMKSREADCVAATKKNEWAGYRILGEQVLDLVFELKNLTYPKNASKAKNVFATLAIKVKDTGGVTDLVFESVGNMAVTGLTKLGEAVLTLVQEPTEDGGYHRVLVTSTKDHWPGRIDGLLDEDNPGVIEPDLSKVLNLIH
jgi:hypothetical protein